MPDDVASCRLYVFMLTTIAGASYHMPMFSDAQKQKHERIAGELSAIRSGLMRTWAQIAHLLAMVDSSEYWKADNQASFTAWLRRQMPLFGLKEALLWRFVMAGRHYVKMLPMLQKWGLADVPLEQLSTKVSPENLEILGRLIKIAPEAEVREKAALILSGAAHRSDMRNWLASYRPALKTDVHKTGKSPASKGLLESTEPRLKEAMIRNTLLRNSAWTGVKDPFIYRVFQDTRLSIARNPVLDLVVAVKETQGQGILQFHGVEVKAGVVGLDSVTKCFDEAARFFDYLWLALPLGTELRLIEQSQTDCGILIVGDGTVSVIREPRQGAQRRGIQRGDLASALLERFL